MKFSKLRRFGLFGIGILLAGLLISLNWPLFGAQAGTFMAQANEVPIYISPKGQDSNPGTLAAPVATISRAQVLARQAAASSRKNVTVYLRGGLYRLSQTLEFTPSDSGPEGYKVTYAAYANERPVLSGGVPIGNWRRTSNGLYTTKVNLRFRQLYVNGQRGIRARFPNGNNYLKMRHWYLDKNADIYNTREENRFLVVNAIDLKSVKIPVDGNAEMIIQRDWTQNRLRIESFRVQGDSGIIGVREPERNSAFGAFFPYKYTRQAYHLENSLMFLDAPGEWFLDPNGNLFYRPRAGETPASIKVIAPRLETLLRINGQPNNPVKNLEFKGLTFMDTTWLVPDQYGNVGFYGPTFFIHSVANQPVENIALTSAITARYAQNLRFSRNRIQNAGGNGLTFDVGVQNSQIIGNVVQNIAASGIVIQGAKTRTKQVYKRPDGSNSEVWAEDFKYRSPEIDQSRNNQVSNNLITKVGLDYPDNHGIFAAYIANTKIEHNKLSNLPYIGIGVGWGWTFDVTDQSNNLIRANEISGALQLLTDGGGIYHLSRSNGTQIVENYIHGMKLSPWASRRVMGAIMLDHGTSGLIVARNVFRNVQMERAIRPQDSTKPILLNSAPLTDNKVQENEGASARIIQNAGLEPAYKDIQNSL